MSNRKIEYISIDEFVPYARNTRTHSDEQVAQIAASIKEFGFNNPVLIDQEGGIIAGHGRVLASRKLKLKDVPCIRLSDLSEAQKKAYIIADNKLALNAGWDDKLLALEIQELQELNFNIDLLGFDDIEMANLFNVVEEDNSPKEEIYHEAFSIIIDCKDEEEQEKIFNRLDSEGYKCRVQSL